MRLRRIHSSSDLYSKGTNAKSFAKFQCPNGIPTVATREMEQLRAWTNVSMPERHSDGCDKGET